MGLSGFGWSSFALMLLAVAAFGVSLGTDYWIQEDSFNAGLLKICVSQKGKTACLTPKDITTCDYEAKTSWASIQVPTFIQNCDALLATRALTMMAVACGAVHVLNSFIALCVTGNGCCTRTFGLIFGLLAAASGGAAIGSFSALCKDTTVLGQNLVNLPDDAGYSFWIHCAGTGLAALAFLFSCCRTTMGGYTSFA
eukprot:Colp12_sorted_trinity150504_noHs@6068